MCVTKKLLLCQFISKHQDKLLSSINNNDFDIFEKYTDYSFEYVSLIKHHI